MDSEHIGARIQFFLIDVERLEVDMGNLRLHLHVREYNGVKSKADFFDGKEIQFTHQMALTLHQ